jgi:hypothetical protein
MNAYDSIYNQIGSDISSQTSKLSQIHNKDTKTKSALLKKIKLLQVIQHNLLILKSMDKKE